MEFEILENEYWWGGNVIEATKMPFDRNTEYFIDFVDYLTSFFRIIKLQD